MDIKKVIAPRVSVVRHSLFSEGMFMEDSAHEKLMEISAPVEQRE